MTHDLRSLQPTEHMLKWLSDNPMTELPAEFERWLSSQVEGSDLLSLRTGEPEWLTGGARTEDNDQKVILARTGVAFPFELEVNTPSGGSFNIAGVCTWAAWGLNKEEPHSKIWFDVDGTMATHGANGTLLVRIYGNG